MAEAELGQRHFMRGIIKKCPISHCPMLITHDSVFERWSVEMVKDEVVEEKYIGGRQIPYILRGEMSTSN